MKTDNFDNLIRQSLDGFEATPPPGVWEAVSSGIDKSAIKTPEISEGVRHFAPIVKNALLIISGVATLATISYLALNSIENNTSNEGQQATEDIENNQVISDEIQTFAEENDLHDTLKVSVMPFDEEEKNSQINKPHRHKHEKDGGSQSLKELKILTTENEPKLKESETEYHSQGSPIMPKPLSDTFVCPGVTLSFYWPNPHKAALLINGTKTSYIHRAGWLNETFDKEGVYLLVWESDGKQYPVRQVKVAEVQARFNCLSLGEGRYQIINSSKGTSRYQWNFGDGRGTSNAFEPVYQYQPSTRESFIVTLKAESPEGCKVQTEMEIRNTNLVKISKPEIPNVFTPGNSDGLNDRFKVKIENEVEFQLVISNTAGKMVFEASNKKSAWDGNDMITGQPCPAGQYIVTLRYRQIDQEPAIERTKLTLIR